MLRFGFNRKEALSNKEVNADTFVALSLTLGAV